MSLGRGLPEGHAGQAASSMGLQEPAFTDSWERQHQQDAIAKEDHDVGLKRWLYRGFLGV